MDSTQFNEQLGRIIGKLGKLWFENNMANMAIIGAWIQFSIRMLQVLEHLRQN
jgi:hypothetical protein